MVTIWERWYHLHQLICNYCAYAFAKAMVKPVRCLPETKPVITQFLCTVTSVLLVTQIRCVSERIRLHTRRPSAHFICRDAIHKFRTLFVSSHTRSFDCSYYHGPTYEYIVQWRGSIQTCLKTKRSFGTFFQQYVRHSMFEFSFSLA